MMEKMFHTGMGDMKTKPGQPLVYGFSMRVGPDGKPHFEQFGNVKQGKMTKEREPLVDVVDLEKEIRVIAELPGVQKDDIHIHAEKDVLELSVKNAEHPFNKRLSLPAEVHADKAKASYKNGILEVILVKKTSSSRKDIKIE